MKTLAGGLYPQLLPSPSGALGFSASDGLPPLPSSLGTASSLSPRCTLLSLFLCFGHGLSPRLSTLYFKNLISVIFQQLPYEVET